MRCLLVLAFLLLAGCSDAPARPEDPTETGDEPLGRSNPGLVVSLTPTNVSVDWVLRFSETQVAGFITSSAQCEELTSSTTMLSGRIVATWDAPHAASEQLRVVVATSTQVLASQEGRSPLTVDFDVRQVTQAITVDIGTVAPVGAANDLEVAVEATVSLEGSGTLHATEVNTCPG